MGMTVCNVIGREEHLANKWPEHPWGRLYSFYYKNLFARSGVLALTLEPWEEGGQ